MHSKLTDYARLLASWPGLVSRPSPDLVQDLVQDGLALLDQLGDARSLIDVGSGGGMPGIPIQIARPELQVTLLEADRRKAAFLVHAAATLGLGGLRVVPERAEIAGHGPLRELFDVAVSRALAPMPVAAELCLPFVRVGGRMLALRSTVEEAWPAIELLGGGRAQIVPAPTQARARGVIVVVPKVAPTPTAYPRRPGLPNKRPLGA